MKTPYVPPADVFDLNFFLCANSGAGKTHLCATYTLGPVHFYMLDKGGERTLKKLLKGRPKSNPISIDNLSRETDTFSAFWKKLQQDEKEGFFAHMAEQNGLVVFDSATSANKKAIHEIMRVNRRGGYTVGKSFTAKTDGMQITDWGQLSQWMTQLVSTIQELPCATATTVHLHTIMDGDQQVVARYPSVNGQFKQIIGTDYDETYLLENRKDKYTIHFKEKHKFQAKSRIFSVSKVTNYTMDMLATAYTNNKPLKGE